MAIDQIAQSGLSSLKGIYYSAQLFSVSGITLEEFPPQTVAIKLADAKRLLSELNKSIGYIKAGIEHTAGEFLD